MTLGGQWNTRVASMLSLRIGRLAISAFESEPLHISSFDNGFEAIKDIALNRIVTIILIIIVGMPFDFIGSNARAQVQVART